MKKIYLLIALMGIYLFSFAQKRCASFELLQQQMATNPAFARKVKETEKSFADYSRKTGAQPRGKPVSLTIPVIVHIVYNTPGQNISDDQVQSQIEVLNEDFTATNSDYNNYDAGYGAVKGDADINFCLVQIIRQQTTHRSFNFSDGVKFTRRGGSDAVNPMNALNIWVCNLGQNLLGYAQFPGGSPETAGVVCHYRAFGKGDEYDLYPDYNLGRTMTHEVGHSLGLRHIWGDANCGNDFVDDTPLHNTANYGCPGEGHLSTCTGTPLEMWMNYMDYTDDRCMYFMSDGQVSRMGFFIDSDPQLQSIFNSTCTQAKNDAVTLRGANSVLSTRTAMDFSVYPTVSNGMVTLSAQAFESGTRLVNVYNVSGIMVSSFQVMMVKGENYRQLDLSRLPAGMYMVKLTGLKTESGTRQLVIRH